MTLETVLAPHEITRGGTRQFDALMGGHTAGSFLVASADVPPTLMPITATWQSDGRRRESWTKAPSDVLQCVT